MIKVVAFDLFGTVFDMSSIPREQMKAYLDHIRKLDWSPLKFPVNWCNLKAFDDAAPGLYRLRQMGLVVVTLSNCPADLQIVLSRNNDIDWDLIIPLELRCVFKPAKRAYKLVWEMTGAQSDECLMVTANKSFGDLEKADELGMRPQLIRGDSDVQTIIQLAKMLEEEHE